MHDVAPLLSPLLPMQLLLRMARGLGLGAPVLTFLLNKLLSKDRKLAVFSGYQPSEHDVFLACFSKSGTNWAMQIVVQVAHLGQADFRHIHDLVAWPESGFPGVVALEDARPWKGSPVGLRGIKTALEAEFVPHAPEARYLCVVRDPKEIFVSGYHFITAIFGMQQQVTFDDWCDRSLRPGAINRGWAHHTAGYWAQRSKPNVLVLTYPELHRDLPGCVDRVAELMGVDLDDQQRAEVIRRAGFAYMKEHEACFAPMRLPLLTGSSRGTMMRRGQMGREAMLSPERAAQIDAVMMSDLQALGSDFPYAELFAPGGARG